MPRSPYPEIAVPVTIDGYTQPGASPNTLALGDNAVLLIEIRGGSGLTVSAAGCTIRGLVINGSTNGIFVFGPGGGSTFVGNFIGTNASGSAAIGNGGGIVLFTGASFCVVGGSTPADRNLISGNARGLHMEGTGEIVRGNYIGTDATGTVSIPNVVAGVENETFGNTIGGMNLSGSCSGACNLISGNNGFGIRSAGQATIQGNFIGTDVTGTRSLPNSGIGILAGTGDLIGGVTPGQGNIIANSGQAGVSILTVVLPGATIRGNSIFSNTGLGIDLNNDGPTPNDHCDGDTGPNGLQNFPVLTSVVSSGGSTSIQGMLDSSVGVYMLDFYSNASCHSSGFGEGRTYLGTTSVTVDSSCVVSFNANLPVSLGPRDRVTATATDSTGNTSEFSACVAQPASYYTVPGCRLIDTRGPSGPYGAPALLAGSDRTFAITGQCGIPAEAQAVAFNFTVTRPVAQGDLRVFPGGGFVPLASILNYRPGQTRASNGVVALGPAGDISVQVDQSSGTVDLVVDVSGCFR